MPPNQPIESPTTPDTPVATPVPFHIHNGVDSARVSYSDLINRTRYVVWRVVDPTQSNTVTSSIGGSFIMPFSGYFIAIAATVDTAGVTSTMSIDIKKNTTTIMANTKLTIDTALTDSRNSTTQPVITTFSFLQKDSFTLDVTAIHTTPAKGLTFHAQIIESQL